MMTMRAVHAGQGYRYLLQSVATNDARDYKVEENRLHDYYAAKGTPPGRWFGSGVAMLGAQSSAQVGKNVTALQMAALYGEGLHPDADAMISRGASLKQTRLGSRFPQITDDVPVLEAIKKEERRFLKVNNRLPSEEEAAGIAMTIGRPFYEAATGYEKAHGKDVLEWINEQKRSVRQAVAGFDFTFSPAKSISVIWALADREIADVISACHREAVEETLLWAEENVIRTRRGAGGIEQVKTKGIIASAFTHFDTRAGDPDLHTHVLISNKVMREDGEWRTLDSKALFKHHHTISTRYDRVLMQKLEQALGFGFSARQRGENKQAVWDVAGISDELIDVFSKRRAMARPIYDRLLNEYVSKNGTQPTDRVAHDLWQQAILETRDAKKPAESLNQLKSNWREELYSSPRGHEFASQVAAVVGRQVTDPRQWFAPFNMPEQYARAIEQAARSCIEELSERRSLVGKRHVDTAVSVYLRRFRFHSTADLERAHAAICDHMLTKKMIQTNAPEHLDLPAELRREDGLAIDKKLGWETYTTPEIITAEREVMQAVEEQTAFTCASSTIAEHVLHYEQSHGFMLNEGQKQLAEHLLTTGTLLATGVGPAGTGKTTSMQIVSSVWRSEGHQVIGLAPSAAAADVLGREIGVQSSTIDALTHTWRGLNPTRPGRDPRALPIEIKPGDMLLVDEAGMASTTNIHALMEIAKQTGAILRMVGDPHQLDAVENGGLFGALTRFAPTAELTNVMRFSKGRDSEQSEASLKIRNGESDAAAFYDERGWIADGTREQMIHKAVAAYQKDVAAGRVSLVVASTNADVDEMNQLIRNARIDAGEVDTSNEVRLARGDVVGLGDTIVTRRNQTTGNGRVMNGELFTVAAIDSLGGVEAVNQKTGFHIYLEPEYVREHTHLGYAATVHRAQGATVDTTHALIDSHTDRSSLYVALTRGKHENRVYAVTDQVLDETAEDAHFFMAGQKAAPTAREVLEAAITRDNRQRSVMEAFADEAAETISPKRIHQLYRYGVDLAYQAYIEAKLPALVDALPAVTDEQQDHLKTAAMRLLARGVDPFALTDKVVGGLDNAHDIASVVAYRWENHVGAHTTHDFPPPPVGYSSSELEEWLQETYETKPWEQPPEPQPEAQTARPATEEEKAFATGRSLTDLLGMTGTVPTKAGSVQQSEPRVPRENGWPRRNVSRPDHPRKTL